MNKSIFDEEDNIVVLGEDDITSSSNLPAETEVSIYRDAISAKYNLLISAFLAFLTVISISAGNADMNLTVFLALVSLLLAIQSITISGKNIGRFFKYGFRHHKPVPLIYYSFVFSISMAYINGYAALQALGFINNSWWA